MIKTQAHYDLLLRKAHDRRILDLLDVEELYRTIEPLRRVTKAAKSVYDNHSISWGKDVDELENALAVIEKRAPWLLDLER